MTDNCHRLLSCNHLIIFEDRTHSCIFCASSLFELEKKDNLAEVLSLQNSIINTENELNSHVYLRF